MKIKCMLDNVEYSNKPIGAEIGKIQNRLEQSKSEITINELAIKLSKGCTFKPALLNGRKASDWLQQEIFALDFDENTTISEQLDLCKELDILPTFGYTSFSHTEEKHKFRLVFACDSIITNKEIRDKLQITLIKVFSKSDQVTFDAGRLFFGGKKLIYENYNSKINAISIINKYYKEEYMISINNQNKLGNIPPDNNKVSICSNIIRGDIAPKQKDTYYNIKAIGERNAEYLKDKINNPHIIFSNNQEFYDYIFKNINLYELLEIKNPSSFRCLFHDDGNPSANIFQNENGYWIYHCFGCGVSYNLLGVIEKIGGFKSRPKAYKFIREIFNLEIQETEWQKEQKEIIWDNLRFINNGDLEEFYPQTYKNIKRNLKYLLQLHMVALDNVYDERLTDDDDNVAFFISNKYLLKMLGMSENSSKEISKKNALFAYHKLINKLSTEEIPEEMLSRALAINVNKENKNNKLISFYSIPSYTVNLLDEAEKQGVQWKENNYTMQGLSREMLYRGEGKEVADRIYPQYKKITLKGEEIDRTTSNTSNDFTILISQIIMELIKEKGYVLESEVINRIDYHKKFTKTQIKKSLKEILDSYALKRIHCNKQIKEQYNVKSNGYPFIIVKEVF